MNDIQNILRFSARWCIRGENSEKSKSRETFHFLFHSIVRKNVLVSPGRAPHNGYSQMQIVFGMRLPRTFDFTHKLERLVFV